jgi:hypothetical protein
MKSLGQTYTLLTSAKKCTKSVVNLTIVEPWCTINVNRILQVSSVTLNSSESGQIITVLKPTKRV